MVRVGRLQNKIHVHVAWLLLLASVSFVRAARMPEPPTRLVVTRVTSDEIDLRWNNNSRNVLGFSLERSTNRFENNFEIVLGRNARAYTDRNLSPSATYCYRVRAWTRKGFSRYSRTVCATTPGPSVRPLAPSDLSVSPVGSTQLTLFWTANSATESGFKIERSTNGFESSVEFVIGPGMEAYSDSGLLVAVPYSYRVRACNSAGCSDYSNIASGSTGVCSPWTPLFHGIEHAAGATAVGVSPVQVVHVLRVNLLDPDVRFTSTPRSQNFFPGLEETEGLTTSHFLLRSGAQAAINGNWFAPCCWDWEGFAEDLWGLAISSNVVVSAQETDTFSTSMLISEDNVPTMIGTNWPPADTAGIYTAVSGKNPLLYGGIYVGTNILIAPRTAIGHSQDKRYLFLMTIDGRQPGYSDGAADLDTAAWMLCFGASDAQNLDGGGSTTMVVSDGQDGARVLNRPIHEGIPGWERVVANHLGVYAKPLDPPVSQPPGSQTGSARGTISMTIANAIQSVVAKARFGMDRSVNLKATPLEDGTCRISIHGQPDYTYRLQSTDSLSDANWQTLVVGRANELGLFDFLDSRASGTRFYRALNP